MVCPACATEIPAGFRFCGNCGTRLDAAPAAPPRTPVPPAGERREVTVLFADVSGFTRLSERLDPEEVHAVMNECFAGLGEALRDEDGYIDKYIGDAVMALFGAPVAHEDDPARACRAALGMQAFLAAFAERCERRTGVPLRMRIGIHCGLVLAGGVGSDVRMDYSVMGDTVNLASRLESNAPPGGVLVSAEVARRARGLFEFGPPRRLAVKGKAEPVEACELLREAGEEEGPDGLAVALVGRDGERAELLARWQIARAGGLRWIELRGEMGIGKTRLVREAAAAVPAARCLTVTVTREGTRPFGLARRLVRAVLREAGGEAGAGSREAFAAALAWLGGDELAPFGDALWHLAAPSRLAVPAPDPDPETLRRTLERGVVRLIECLARRRPESTVVLDAYERADAASAALLESRARLPEGWPLPVIVASREGDRPPVRPEAVIRLGRLADAAAGELVDRLVRGARVPDALRRAMLARAQGVPLYLEEMVRALRDRGVLVPAADGAGWVCAAEDASVSLPGSLRAAMVARLDRLPRAERDLLCQCAVQGVEIDVAVADAVQKESAGGPNARAAALLAALEGRGLVARLDAARVAFSQPLMQEACYETLTLRDRRALHAWTADALSGLAGGAHAVAPELLAYHEERAERWAPAAAAHLRAGDREAELYENAGALARYARALETVGRVAAPAVAAQRVAALAHGGAARVHLRTGAYAKAEEHATAMRAAATGAGDRAEAERLLAAACGHTGRTAEAEQLLASAVALARADGPPDVLARALHDLAVVCHRGGRLAEARAHLAEARAAAPPDARVATLRADMLEGRIAHTEGRFADAVALYGRASREAERVGSLSERARAANDMGNAAHDLGDHPAAERHFRQALLVWTRAGDAEGMAGAANNLGNVAMSRGDVDAAEAHYAGALAAWREIGNVGGAGLARANLAILAIERGDGARAVAEAEAALATLGESGHALLRGLARVVLGEARWLGGDAAAARTEFARVLDECDESHQPLAVAGAWRGLGRIALGAGALAEAQDLLGRAAAAFERLQRAQEAARTAVDRAEALWRAGDGPGARALLVEARARFAAIRAERDLARVERLLGEMASL